MSCGTNHTLVLVGKGDVFLLCFRVLDVVMPLETVFTVNWEAVKIRIVIFLLKLSYRLSILLPPARIIRFS